MAERKLTVVIAGDAKGLDKAIGSADKSVSGLDKQVGGFSKNAKLGLAAVGVGALAMGKSFVDSAVESQKVTKQTEAVLKSMGNGAGVTAAQVAKLSEKLAMQSGIDDELIQSGANVLLTFGKVRNEVGKGNDIFNRATQTALDMSVALGVDLSAANIQLGKALNDPIKGMTALARAGVSFTQQQKDQVAAMVAAGDTLGAQKLILAEMEKQFGGSAAAQATSGEKLAVVWGNLQEKLGAGLLPVIDTVAGGLTGLLNGFESLPDPVQSIITKVATVGGVALTAGAGISFLADHTRNMKANIGGLLPDLTSAEGGMTRFGKAVTGLAVVGAVYGLVQLGQQMSGLKINVDELTRSLESSTAAESKRANEFLLAAGNAGQLNDKIAELADTNAAGAKRLVEHAEAAGVDSDKIAELNEIIKDKQDADVQGAIDQKTNTAAIQEGAAAADDLSASLQEVADKLRAQFDPLFGAQDAVLRLKEAQDAAAKATRDHGAGSDEAMAANQRAAQAALGYEGALLHLKSAVESGDVSLADSRAVLQRWVQQGHLTQAQADQVAATFDEVKRRADELDGRNINMTVNTKYTSSGARNAGTNTSGGGRTPLYAKGGVHPGPRGVHSPALVSGGEGIFTPEQMLALGGAIRNNGSGTGVTIHIDARGAILGQADLDLMVAGAVKRARALGIAV